MLSIERKESQVTRPNLLPCRLSHNGPVPETKRLWRPESNENGEQTAYFRGRKLKGRAVKVPDGYRGAVLKVTDNLSNETKAANLHQELEDEEIPQVKVAEELATFDEVVVWGHEVVHSETDDPYSKGMQEWIKLAEAIHSYEDDASTARQKSNRACSVGNRVVGV